ncbi:hypothetical protein A6R68_16615 [Neotoma lepida]|uniref:Uncharacterized protein n=1 Tax=Neotoma lepida TaxID=56216 RepID=A0A1A6HGZ3_NEOLE|nr:hypothetical protein A6R68_16615 [Neotoma lepida]
MKQEEEKVERERSRPPRPRLGNSRWKVWWSPAPPGGPPPGVPSPARRLDSTPAARTQLLYRSPCRFPNSPNALYSPVPHPPFHL